MALYDMQYTLKGQIARVFQVLCKPFVVIQPPSFAGIITSVLAMQIGCVLAHQDCSVPSSSACTTNAAVCKTHTKLYKALQQIRVVHQAYIGHVEFASKVLIRESGQGCKVVCRLEVSLCSFHQSEEVPERG